MSDKKRNYRIGYCRPPHHSRFQKGQSGNPKGRPGGSKNLLTLFTEALNEEVIVADDGGQRKITKREAMVKQVVDRSTIADPRAVKIVLDVMQRIEIRTDAASSETSAFTQDDEKTIEQLKARLRGNKPQSDD